MTKRYLMGLDNGGTLIKAAIFDLYGNEIAIQTGKPELITPAAGFEERDMEALWQLNCDCIRGVLKRAAIDPAELIGISISGHGKGLYLWGKDNRPAYHGIVSTDVRAQSYVNRWYQDGTYEKVKEKTCQNFMACQPVALLCWLKDHAPDVIENTQYVFSVKDYIRYRLTGEAYAEITDCSGTNLLDIIRVCYDRELLAAYGLEEIYEKLAPLKYSYEPCGRITADVAQCTGLKEGTMVAAGMFDIDACAIAMDITCEERLAMIAGTWGINEYIARKPVLNGTIRMNSLFAMPGYYLIEESSTSSVGNADWYMRMFMGEERELAKQQGKAFYELTDRLVSSVPPEQQDVIFLPFVFGHDESDGINAKASFVGLLHHHTKAHVLRAVYEGVAFSHRRHNETLMQNRQKPAAYRLAGGAANSRVWVQIFADVMQTPIEIIDAKELGALGAAMAASIAAGVYADYQEAASHMVRIRETVYPNPEKAEIYQQKYEMFLSVIEALNPIWKKMADAARVREA